MSSITLKESRAKVVTFASSGRSVLLRPRLATTVSSAEAEDFKKDFSFLVADIDESTPEPVKIVVKSTKEKAKKKEKSDEEEDTKVSSSTNLGGDFSKKSAKRKFRKRKRKIV